MIIKINYRDYYESDERLEGINDAFRELKQTEFDSFSILMFFRNRKPLRIRSNVSESFGKGERTNDAIEQWTNYGQGPMIIKTTSRSHMNDIYPSKSMKEFPEYDGDLKEEIFFHYYEGKYGNQDLWRMVYESRRNPNTTVGDTVKNYFMNREIGTIMEDIKFYDSEEDDYTYRDFEYTVYDNLGDSILQVGRNEVEGEYEHITPRGTNFIGGYDE